MPGEPVSPITFPRTAKRLSEAFKEAARDTAQSNYEGQRRNTIAFKREADAFRALLRRWLDAGPADDLGPLIVETREALDE